MSERIEVKAKRGIVVSAQVIPGPHGPQWEVTDGRRYRALLPTCVCARKGCGQIKMIATGRARTHKAERQCQDCHYGWHEPIVRKFAAAVAKTIK